MQTPIKYLFPALILFFIMLNPACKPKDTIEPIQSVRSLEPTLLATKAISYSGFREGQSPGTSVYPTQAEVLEDLQLLVDEGFGFIRIFSANQHGQDVVEVIDAHDLPLKVQLGAYVQHSDPASRVENYAELDRAIELANTYPDVVKAVSVGNETLVSWSFVAVPPKNMIEYIRYLRPQIEQPVTVNDNWEPFAAAPDSDLHKVWTQIDYASVHTYAFWDAAFNLWDFRQSDVAESERARALMDAAFAYAQQNFNAVRAALDAGGLSIPIVIGESGWQSFPSAREEAAYVQDFAQHLAHPVNQAMYYDDMMAWAYGPAGESPGDGFERPAAMFYFAAFDEPWKEADDNWGLWNADRERKYVLHREGSVDEAVFYRENP
ncbi:MAG: hypothetical protein JJU20_13310 [Opitutales bacterium]|nr:hypothetical protein [Opitutales bacterium]